MFYISFLVWRFNVHILHVENSPLLLLKNKHPPQKKIRNAHGKWDRLNFLFEIWQLMLPCLRTTWISPSPPEKREIIALFETTWFFLCVLRGFGSIDIGYSGRRCCASAFPPENHHFHRRLPEMWKNTVQKRNFHMYHLRMLTQIRVRIAIN